MFRNQHVVNVDVYMYVYINSSVSGGYIFFLHY